MSVLWTVMPAELIWASEGEPERRLVRHRGRLVVARVEGDGVGVVESLLSTDPRDFLDPAWQPGVRLRLPEASEP